MSFVTVTALEKSYRTATQTLRVLRGLDLSVEQGEMVAIVGASGVGKSTLLHVLGGLDQFEAGTIRIGDADLSQMTDADRVVFRNRHVGFVFQFHHLLPEFTALENTEMPLRIARMPVRGRAGGRGGAPAARRSRRPAWPPAGHAVGRRAAAGGDRPRAGPASRAAPRRRADGRPRRADGRLAPRTAARDAPRAAASRRSSPRTTCGWPRRATGSSGSRTDGSPEPCPATGRFAARSEHPERSRRGEPLSHCYESSPARNWR